MNEYCKYFSPVTDVTFRKVFGEHIDLAASLLNAFLPLEEGRTITDLRYLPPELMPNTPTRKDSIVDLHCTDSAGATFLVEMQLNWESDFFKRVFFNASKAYVQQLGKGEEYKLLQPVYSLNFVTGDLHKGLNEWYHPYQFVHIYHTDRVFDGLKIVFAEIDKYKKLDVKGDSKKDLWMRYFTEMTADTRTPAPELLADPDIAKAVKLLEVINYNKAEEYLYDRYWDGVSVEATWKGIGRDEGEKIGEERGLEKGLKQGREEGLQKGLQQGREEGLQQGLQQGRDEGLQKGLQQGREEERRSLVRNLYAAGLDLTAIAKMTGLETKEIVSFI